MDDEAALQRAIADQPEEDTPRLAYADYLDELGGEANIARAEFIRLQVMLYRLTFETLEAKAARLRTRELLERYRLKWGFPPKSKRWQDSSCTIRRGFVDEWVLALDQKQTEVKRFIAYITRFPIRRLRIADRASYLRRAEEALNPSALASLKLLDVPALQKIKHLEINGQTWADEGVHELFSLEHFPSLTSLALIGVAITSSGVAAIARLPKFISLRSLRISFTGMFSATRRVDRGVLDSCAEALATSSILCELRELSLRATGIGSRGAMALAASPTLTKLEQLLLTENPEIGDLARDALRQRFGDIVFL
jgi:uncharacterized protein (TIGR02996 family)